MDRRKRASFLFDRWPRLAARHPWRVLAGALAILALSAALSLVAGGGYTSSFAIPGTESQRLMNLLEERFPERAGDSAAIVIRAPAGLDDPGIRSRVESLLRDLENLPEVVMATSPYDRPADVSADGTIARIDVQYAAEAHELEGSSIDALLDLRRRYSAAGLQVEAGGQIIHLAEWEPPGRTELIGLAAAVTILLIAFGSVVAMSLPVVTALLALASGLLLVGAASRLVEMPSFTPQFGAMIGLGAGIDYALLIVTRFREGLARQLALEDAIVEASATAGRSVLFAGGTVVIALLGLWAIGIPAIAYVGTAASLVVALSVLVTLLVLPAILRLVGTHVDRWRLPLFPAAAPESETGAGYRLSRFIQRFPVPALVLSLALVTVMAVPVLRMRLGLADDGNRPESFTSRRAYDLLSRGFGPGSNGPILIGVRIDDPAGRAAVSRLPETLSRLPGVATSSTATLNSDGTAAVMTIIPRDAPQSEETADLVHRLRNTLNRTFTTSTTRALVGGSTAAFIDVGDRIGTRLPIFFPAVIGLSFLLLMAVFRSLVVPLKAAAMNLLSIGAAYGVLVAVFQWGWLGGVLGVGREGPIESFLPMMMFAVLFGLSMDYEVFLISRIQEEYLKTGSNGESVARGLSLTTRLISAAAAIMVAVFLSFAFSDERAIKEFGLGLATAIFLDATLVRLVLVPSLMHLLGDANWWFPRWLDRRVPRIGLERRAVAPDGEPTRSREREQVVVLRPR